MNYTFNVYEYVIVEDTILCTTMKRGISSLGYPSTRWLVSREFRSIKQGAL